MTREFLSLTDNEVKQIVHDMFEVKKITYSDSNNIKREFLRQISKILRQTFCNDWETYHMVGFVCFGKKGKA